MAYSFLDLQDMALAANEGRKPTKAKRTKKPKPKTKKVVAKNAKPSKKYVAPLHDWSKGMDIGIWMLMKPGASVDASSELLDDSAFVAEKKYDGVSGYLVFDENGQMSAFSPKRDVTGCLPEVSTSSLAGWVVQVEYIAGVPSTSANVATFLSSSGWRAAKSPGVVVLDVLASRGPDDVRNRSLDRRGSLRGLVATELKRVMPSGFRILEPAWAWLNKRAFYDVVVEQGGEGIVLKARKSVYEVGKSKAWIKCKVVRSCDCWVRGYKPGIGKYAGTVGALRLELLQDDEIVEVGFASGMTDEQRHEFKQHLDAGRDFVAEVQFQNWTSGDRLRHPRFIRIRDDKNWDECTWEAQGPKEIATVQSLDFRAAEPFVPHAPVEGSWFGSWIAQHPDRSRDQPAPSVDSDLNEWFDSWIAEGVEDGSMS